MTKLGKKRKKRMPFEFTCKHHVLRACILHVLAFVTGFEIELLLEVSKPVI